MNARFDRREMLKLASMAPLAIGLGCAKATSLRPVAGMPGHEELETERGVVPIGPPDPQLGSRSAPVTLVSFADFMCPFCREFDASIMRVHRELSPRVRLVFKHLPLPMHRHARSAAVAAQLVFLEAGSDAFWAFHARLFAEASEATPSTLALWVRQAGVSEEAIERRASDAELKVAADLGLARRLSIDGAPFSFIGRRAVNGAYPYEQLRAWVKEAL